MNWERPNFQNILVARELIKAYMPRTPMYSYPYLNELLGTQVYIKHENHTPTGVFKARGALFLFSRLNSQQKDKGVITASTGNHAQSIAYAGHLFNVPVTIVMPEKANPSKVKAVKSWGAKIIFHGKIFDESRVYAQQMAEETGSRFVHPANEPDLIAGVGTYALEIFEDVPSTDVIIVPVGGGSGASGCCLIKEAVNPDVQVIGVQAEQAPAACLSWRSKEIVTAKMETKAEGLATQVGFELTQEILQDYLSDFILVSEKEMQDAMLLIMEVVRNMVEEAGSASTAAALKIKDQLEGKTVVIVLTGGNSSLDRLRTIL
ncbi:threonine/serine dehydratase [Acidobacteriota bacterium]